MYDELCRHCGHKESAHDIFEGLQQDPSLTDDETFVKAKVMLGTDLPCERFESEIEHAQGCPIVLDIDNREVYCQNLKGGCSKLISL